MFRTCLPTLNCCTITYDTMQTMQDATIKNLHKDFIRHIEDKNIFASADWRVCHVIVASSPGHSQILACSRGGKSGSGLGTRLVSLLVESGIEIVHLFLMRSLTHWINDKCHCIVYYRHIADWFWSCILYSRGCQTTGIDITMCNNCIH